MQIFVFPSHRDARYLGLVGGGGGGGAHQAKLPGGCGPLALLLLVSFG